LIAAVPPATQRVLAAARHKGLTLEVHQFPEGTKTAADAAAAIGCSVAAIVKSLVFMVGQEPVLALVPGDLMLDPRKLEAVAGTGPARRATLEEVRSATGFAAGGTPPFGHDQSIRVFADEALRRNDPVWAAAGTPTTVFPISLRDLDQAVSPSWGDLSSREEEFEA
jgi:prolyl-tRNA editing enzyme YbaK/EbsC (Cys-tRNA(Pro) deacylase)